MTNISLQQSKLIKRLTLKKYRKTEGLFIAEGVKLFREFYNSSPELIEHVFLTEEQWVKNKIELEGISFSIHSEKDIAKNSQLKTSPGLIVILKTKEEVSQVKSNWTLVLTGVGDPGNLGSIIRLADWYGIDQVWCSEGSADCYNIKVVQATMGSLSRVEVKYLEEGALQKLLHEDGRPVLKAEMQGESIYKVGFPEKGILIMGSESHGVPVSFSEIGESVTIPRFGASESLNVGMACGIIVSHIFA